MGGGHHAKHPPIPDYKIYKVESVKELVEVREKLARLGLKNPWLRNDVWKYERPVTLMDRVSLGTLRYGFKYGLVAAIITTAIGMAMDDGHGHGHGHGHDEGGESHGHH